MVTITTLFLYDYYKIDMLLSFRISIDKFDFHGLHVFTGVLYLCFMYKQALDGKFDTGNYNQLEIAGLFWHFVDLVWILVFTFVYLL